MFDTAVRFIIYTALVVLTVPVIAHEARPAYLEIRQGTGGILEIDWTRPLRNGRALALEPVFPERCVAQAMPVMYQLPAVVHENWQLDCGPGDITGARISISGLNNTISDVLLRFRDNGNNEHFRVLDKQSPVFTVPGDKMVSADIAPYYFRLGVEHILTGSDHLLFVLALILLIQGLWRLVKTITAFTLAHSISLGAAILGYVSVPSTPVEAVIALSIVFLACELVRRDNKSVTINLPWLIAAVFGLVHGLGFAGGLTEIGLPEGEIPLALLMFNLGVEAGQVLFIMMVILLMQGARLLKLEINAGMERIVSYAIGGIGAFWLIERVNGFY